MRIRDGVALVTGGGSGMGAAVCRYLAEQGAKLIVIDKAENAAVQIAKELGGLAYPCDVADGAALEEVFSQIEHALTQPISMVVNCAGIAPAKRIVGKSGPVSLAWFSEVIQVNLIGTFNVMRLAAAMMIPSIPNQDGERGVIINTASVAAFEGQIGQTAYSASKGGVVAMTLPAARELAQFGIRVLAIAPGLIDTPMLEGMPNEVKSALQSQTLFPKRFGKASEFAALVGHLITNSYLNGEVIRLDGGVRLAAT